MKKLGIKCVGITLSMILMKAVLAAEPSMESITAPSNEDVLTPGAKVIAGLPGKNDFYILGQNEKMPTELTDKAKEDAAAKKALIVQQKAKTAPVDTTAESAVPTAITDNAVTPLASPALNMGPAADAKKTSTDKAQENKAVSSMKKTKSQHLAANKHSSKPAYLTKIAQTKVKPNYLQKEAQTKSHHISKQSLALKTRKNDAIKNTTALKTKKQEMTKRGLALKTNTLKHSLAAKTLHQSKTKLASKAHSKSLQNKSIVTV